MNQERVDNRRRKGIQMVTASNTRIGINRALVVTATIALSVLSPHIGLAQGTSGFGARLVEYYNGTAYKIEGGNGYTQVSSNEGNLTETSASLNPNFVDASYGFNGGPGGSEEGVIYDTITTGTVPAGATMTLSAIGLISLQAGAPTGVSQSAGLTLDVYQGTFNTQYDYAYANESASSNGAVGSATTTEYPLGESFTTTNSVRTPNIPLITSTGLPVGGLISTTFYVYSNSSYFIDLIASAGISQPYSQQGYSYYPGIYDSVDPSWYLSTSPGVTYTTASGFAIGGVPAAAAAPEPGSAVLALAGISTLPVAGLLRRRGARISG